MDDVLNEDGTQMTPVDYVVHNDPTRKILLSKIEELESLHEVDDSNISCEAVEANMEKVAALYELLEDDGVAQGRAINILKELGLIFSRNLTVSC